MFKIKLLALLAILLATAGLEARQVSRPDGPGQDLLSRGRYAEAEAWFRGQQVEGYAGLARALWRLGRLAEAERVARLALDAGQEEARVVLARVMLEKGLPQAVLELFPSPKGLGAEERLVLGQAREALGQELESLLGEDKPQNPRDMAWLGELAWLAGRYHDANALLRQATKAQPDAVQAWVSWGLLFLEKYNAADALRCFDDALRITADLPDALVGRAQARLEREYNAQAAMKEVEGALRIRENHIPALLLKARLSLDLEAFEEARRCCLLALAQNPRCLEAHSLLAAIDAILDDHAGLASRARTVLALNPRYGRLWVTVAELLAKRHRYQEAMDLSRRALDLDPKDWRALALMGQNASRVGDDRKAKELLERAFDLDPFNVRVYNLLNLFDSTLSRMVEKKSRHFILRMEPQDSAVLAPLWLSYLEESYQSIKARMGVELEGPVRVEAFGGQESYAVRTVGLPRLGSLGTCFGGVITTLAPRQGRFNWAMVLYHELAHSFHLQISRGRVPRWFTEGLAVRETALADVRWAPRSAMAVRRLLENDKLPPMESLNRLFFTATTRDDLLTAYALSSMVLDFLEERHGKESILALLKAFGRGVATSKALEETLGQGTEDTNRALRAYLSSRLGPLALGQDPWPGLYEDLKGIERRALGQPEDPDRRAELAISALFHGKARMAQKEAQAALKLQSDHAVALFAHGHASAALGREKDAVASLEALAKAGRAGAESLRLLAALAMGRGEAKEALTWLERARAADPEEDGVLKEMGATLLKLGREEEAWDMLTKAVEMDPQDGKILQRLLARAMEKDAVQAERLSGWAMQVAPFDPQVNLNHAKILANLKKRPQALQALERLQSLPQVQAEILLETAKIRMELGDKKGALRDIERALNTTPQPEKIKELLKGRE